MSSACPACDSATRSPRRRPPIHGGATPQSFRSCTLCMASPRTDAADQMTLEPVRDMGEPNRVRTGARNRATGPGLTPESRVLWRECGVPGPRASDRSSCRRTRRWWIGRLVAVAVVAGGQASASVVLGVVQSGEPGGEPLDRGLELGVQVGELLQPLGDPVEGHLVVTPSLLQLLDASIREIHAASSSPPPCPGPQRRRRS